MGRNESAPPAGAREDGAVVVAATRSIAEHRQRAEELENLHRTAKRAGEERAHLLAKVSQELRTPLNAIIGYAEMLKGKDGSGPMAKEYAEIIHFSGQHMLGVVSTLLDLSAVEAGSRDLDPESLDVAELVQDCCRTMASSADRAGVAIAQHVSRNMPELFADRQACEQILLNLLSNAVKFTPRGGLVTVQAKREGERIAFTVRDTGIGAPGAELPQARRSLLSRLVGPPARGEGRRPRPLRGARPRRPASGTDQRREHPGRRHERHREPARRGWRNEARRPTYRLHRSAPRRGSARPQDRMIGRA